MLADLVMAASNEALRAARAKVESKMKACSRRTRRAPARDVAARDRRVVLRQAARRRQRGLLRRGRTCSSSRHPGQRAVPDPARRAARADTVEEYERGAGQVVGEWAKLDGSDDVRVTAKTAVRLIAVDRAAFEAALSGETCPPPLPHAASTSGRSASPSSRAVEPQTSRCRTTRPAAAAGLCRSRGLSRTDTSGRPPRAQWRRVQPLRREPRRTADAPARDRVSARRSGSRSTSSSGRRTRRCALAPRSRR